MKEKTHLSLPPVVLVIAGTVIAITAAAVLLSTLFGNMENYHFRAGADLTKAECTDINTYTYDENGTPVLHYIVYVRFKANFNECQTSFDDTDIRFSELNPGDTVEIYYQRSDPSICRPTTAFPDNTAKYIIFLLVFAAGTSLAVYNLKTILRSLKPYARKLVHENDVTEVYTDGKTDPYSDNGLSDSSIDYSAHDSFSDSIMESYADPFAAYSGYEEPGEHSDN